MNKDKCHNSLCVDSLCAFRTSEIQTIQYDENNSIVLSGISSSKSLKTSDSASAWFGEFGRYPWRWWVNGLFRSEKEWSLLSLLTRLCMFRIFSTSVCCAKNLLKLEPLSKNVVCARTTPPMSNGGLWKQRLCHEEIWFKISNCPWCNLNCSEMIFWPKLFLYVLRYKIWYFLKHYFSWSTFNTFLIDYTAYFSIFSISHRVW